MASSTSNTVLYGFGVLVLLVVVGTAVYLVATSQTSSPSSTSAVGEVVDDAVGLWGELTNLFKKKK